MVSAIIADGYLLKKKRDDSRNFLASKYQRRYFELTADTLAYAKDPRELKDGGGDIEVFAIHELKYIKKLEDCKLEMKFPERVLRVKAVSNKEHDRWYEVIKDARQKKLDGNNTPQAKQLETLKEHTKQQILTALEEDSDDDPPIGTTTAAKKPDLQVAPLNIIPKSGSGAINNRPPSPRSLLANPRMGTMMIAPSSHKNMDHEEEEEEEPPQPATKPRSRWQDEEEEEEEEQAQSQQQKQQQQKQPQPQHHGSGTNGKHAGNPVSAAAVPPAQPAANERLMLQTRQEPQGNGAKSGAAAPRTAGGAIPPAPARGEKLQLADTSRQASASAAAAAAAAAPPQRPSAPTKRPSRDNAEKLSLGGPTAPVPVSRGSTPPGGERPSTAGGDPPTEGTREEWEDDDWDSSDDDEEEAKKRAAKIASAAAGPARPGQRPSASGHPSTTASGSGRSGSRGNASGSAAAVAPTQSGDEAGGGGLAGPRRVSGDDRGLRGTAPAASQVIPGSSARKSIDHGSTGPPRPPSSGSGMASAAASAVPAVGPTKSKASPPPPPSAWRHQKQRQQDEVDEEDEDKEVALVKHAAGTDHLEDNWDSEEEDAEEVEKNKPPPKPAAMPAAPSPRQMAVKTSPHAPQSRIPGPPPAAAAPVRPTPPGTASHAPTTGIARPPAAQKQPAAPPVGPSAGRPRGRVSQEGSTPPAVHPPVKAASGNGAGASAAARQKLELSGGEHAQSNVVHDPNVKADDSNWVEEDWDDDDD